MSRENGVMSYKIKQITDTVTFDGHVRANVFRQDSKNSRLSSIAATNLTLRYCGRVKQEADKELVNRLKISSRLISLLFLLKVCSHPHEFLTCFSQITRSILSSPEAVCVLTPPSRREDYCMLECL
jgi:hypothetical protein